MDYVLKQRTEERDDARKTVDELHMEISELQEQLFRKGQSRAQQSSPQPDRHSQDATGQVSRSEAAQKTLQIELENERQSHQSLQKQFAFLEEQLRNLKAETAQGQAASERERTLRQGLEKYQSELEAANTKISALKTTIAHLSKQLQAEKNANVGKCPPEKCKDHDLDDEEPLLGAIKRESTGSSRNGASLPIRPNMADPIPRTPLRTQPSQAPFETSTSKAKNTKPAKTFQSNTNSVPIPEASKKRKRPCGEHNEKKFADQTSESARTPRRTKRSPASIPYEPEYTFTAITGYADDGKEEFVEPEDVKKCAFLCERIDKTTDIWVHGAGKGYYWIHELMRKDIDWTSRPCITKKLARRKTRRRPGDNGSYACLDCVANGRLCFTLDLNETGLIETEGGVAQLILLPMHEGDRKYPVIRGKSEVRYWLNDFTEFEDEDVRKKDEGDELYED